MPELPEVECWGRRVAERAVLGRTVVSAWAKHDERIVIDGVSPRKLVAALTGRRVEGCHRVGKQMWWAMDRGPHPLWHFGMTGSFEHYHAADPRPRFAKVELTLDDGWRFAFADPRRFGRVRLRADPLGEAPLSGLGPDALHQLPPRRWFEEQLARRRTPIKALLLNQAFLAGVGNWIADEVCYHAKIAPQRPAPSLSPDQVGALRQALKHVLDKACGCEADSARFPRTWLFHDRWGKHADARTGRGEAIDFDVVAGRTTAWVPQVQR